MVLEKFRSTESYILCGRIGVFALPICLIITKWCKLVGGVAYGPSLVGLFTLIPASLLFGFVYIILTFSAVEESKNEELKFKINLIADIGYIMYIAFMFSGLPLFCSLGVH